MKKLVAITLFLCFLFQPFYAQVYPLRKLDSKKHQVTCSSFSNDGKLIATGGMNNKLVIWDAESGEMKMEIKGLKDIPISIVFSPDGRKLYSGGKDNKITIWDLNDGLKVAEMKGHKGTVRSIAISPDGAKLVSASDDEKVMVWNLKSFEMIAEVKAHKGEAKAVDFNSDGTKIISGGEDGYIREWNANSLSMLRELKAHKSLIRSVIYSPDDEFIASGGDDKRINIWDAYSFEEVNSIRAHSKWIQTLSFSPDGQYIVSGSHDGYLVLVNTSTGQIVFNSDKQDYYVLTVAFNPNGKNFVSGTFYSDELSVWDVSELNINPPLLADNSNESGTKEPAVKKSVFKPKIEMISPKLNDRSVNGSVLVEAKIISEATLKRLEVFVNDKKVTDLNQSDLAFNEGDYSLKQNVFLQSGNNSVLIKAHNIAGVTETSPVTVLFKAMEKPQISWNIESGKSITEPKLDIGITLNSEERSVVNVFLNDKLIHSSDVKKEQLANNSFRFDLPLMLENGSNTIKMVAENSAGQAELLASNINYSQPIAEVKEEIKAEVQEVIPQKTFIQEEVTSSEGLVGKPVKPNPYRFALIIGNEDYHTYQVGLSSESDVEFAEKDATEFKQYAIQYLGVPDENIEFKINARYIEMMRSIKKISGVIEMTGGKAEVFFYYAGHGFPDEKTKEPYFVPVDGSGADLEFSAIKQKYIYDELTKFASKHVTCFIDACFSGGARGQGLMSARAVKVKPKEGVLTKNLVVFTASSEDQSSLPYKAKEHGMFTYFLLEKIKETNGEVSYKELSDYISEQVGIKSFMVNSKKQVPQTNVSPIIQNTWGEMKLRK